MGLKKNVFSLIIVLTLLGIFFEQTHSAQAETEFTDVNINAPYYNELQYLVSKAIVNGYPDNTFRPDNPVTREEAAKMVGIALGLKGDKRTTDFPDVPATDYASGYIQSLHEKGFLNGYPDGTFHPHQVMKRDEMAWLISSAFQLSEIGTYLPYLDVSQDAANYEPINKVTTAGFNQGFPDGTFRPSTDISRAHFSLMVARALDPKFIPAPAPLPAPKEASVYATGLNVRQGPSANYHSLGMLSNGQSVQILNTIGDWGFVTAGDLKGYVSLKYIIIGENPLQNRTIVIDPGHGGIDPGAIGINGTHESYINYQYAVKALQALSKTGAKVILTRYGDVNCLAGATGHEELQCRVDIAEKNNADVFISIHSNASSIELVNGTETHFNDFSDSDYPEVNDQPVESKILAYDIQKDIQPAIGSNNRGVVDDHLYVTRMNTVPAALIELGFITNPTDYNRLMSEDTQNRFADSLVTGLRQYFIDIQQK